jgi:hypothetical protein
MEKTMHRVMDRTFETPEDLVAFAREGHLPKAVLADQLTPESRGPFLAACARVEREYTEACTAKNDPCLESGCSLEGETCLDPLQRAGDEYLKACAKEWLTFFQNPASRADEWKH